MAENETDFKTEVTVEEVRSKIGDLIYRVSYQNQRITVTRWGKPVVAIVSLADLARLEEVA